MTPPTPRSRRRSQVSAIPRFRRWRTSEVLWQESRSPPGRFGVRDSKTGRHCHLSEPIFRRIWHNILLSCRASKCESRGSRNSLWRGRKTLCHTSAVWYEGPRKHGDDCKTNTTCLRYRASDRNPRRRGPHAAPDVENNNIMDPWINVFKTSKRIIYISTFCTRLKTTIKQLSSLSNV